jgi:hypothetical protein
MSKAGLIFPTPPTKDEVAQLETSLLKENSGPFGIARRTRTGNSFLVLVVNNKEIQSEEA